MAKNIRLTIGEFSKFCRVTVKTLKHYEKLGLLVPNEVDEWTRYRYYDVSQMRQLSGILRLKAMGFSLEEIRDMLDEGTHKPSIPQIEEKIRTMEQQMTLLQERLTALRNIVNYQRQIETADKIFIQRLPAITVASHRSILRHYEDLGPLCENKIDPEIHRLGCKRSQPAYCFQIDHETEFRSENVDVEFCVQVDDAGRDTSIIRFKQLEEVPMAVCIKCYGPYHQLYSHFEEVFRYIDSNGYRITGPHRTVYVDGAWNQQDPAKWLSIIQVPVTKNV